MLKGISRLRWLVLFVILILIVPVAFANSYTWIATLDASQSFYRVDGPYPGQFACSNGIETDGDYYYDTITFGVSTSGLYNMEVVDYTDYDDPTFVLYEGSFNAGSPLQNCIVFNDDIDDEDYFSRINMTLAAGRLYTLVVTTYDYEEMGNYTVEFSGPGDICIGGCEGDGRINIKDAGPVVVYPDGEGGIHLYLPNGQIVMSVSAAEFAAVGVPTDENAFVAMDESIGLYVLRLTTGEYQVNMFMPEGKTYTFIFDAPYAGAPYTSFESE